MTRKTLFRKKKEEEEVNYRKWETFKNQTICTKMKLKLYCKIKGLGLAVFV